MTTINNTPPEFVYDGLREFSLELRNQKMSDWKAHKINCTIKSNENES